MKGGKSKYYLNGCNATNEKIKQIFQSVQLNVNNPHFLIMQGKVTLVAKMRPKELLGLLEETAGTSLYEGKKKTAQTTIEKKDKKLEEIEILCGPIQEKIERQRKEREMLAMHRKNEEQLGKIRRILVAHKYYEATHAVEASRAQIAEMETRQGEITAALAEATARLDSIAKNLDEQKGRQGAEIKTGIERAREAVSRQQKEHNALAGEIAAREKAQLQSERELAEALQEAEEVRLSRERRARECDELKISIGRVQSEAEEKASYLRQLEGELDQSRKGGSAQDRLRPMLERLKSLEETVGHQNEEIDMRKTRMEGMKKRRQELEARLKDEKSVGADFGREKAQLITELGRMNRELEQMETAGVDSAAQRKAAEEPEIKRRQKELAEELERLQSKCHFDVSVSLFQITAL